MIKTEEEAVTTYVNSLSQYFLRENRCYYVQGLSG